MKKIILAVLVLASFSAKAEINSADIPAGTDLEKFAGAYNGKNGETLDIDVKKSKLDLFNNVYDVKALIKFSDSAEYELTDENMSISEDQILFTSTADCQDPGCETLEMEMFVSKSGEVVLQAEIFKHLDGEEFSSYEHVKERCIEYYGDDPGLYVRYEPGQWQEFACTLSIERKLNKSK